MSRQNDNMLHFICSSFVVPGDTPPVLVLQIFLYVLIVLGAAVLLGGLVKGGMEISAKNWPAILGAPARTVLATTLIKTVG